MQNTGTILLGTSAATEALRRDIELAARSHAKVLILGETGAGKEVVARSIHEQSARAARPFVAINCSGIPETLLESELFGHARGSFTDAYRDKPGVLRQAHGGTLFLDELGEMSLRMQALLLRFVETGEINPVGADMPTQASDVRLITATNRDLRAQVDAGAFREDLYFRLNVIKIHVAPLRDRAEDVPVLLDYYLEMASESHALPKPELTQDAHASLCAYAWPGNVRELRNMAERLVLADWQRPVAADDLPTEVRGEPLVSTPATPTIAAGEDAGTTRGTRSQASRVVEQLLARFAAGEDFWSAVYHPFKAREITRHDLSLLIDAGLRKTNGSYRNLLAVFNLPTTDYKRFHAFLYQQNCNLPVAAYKTRRPRQSYTATDRRHSATI
jgi:DNA-binding NtrC family response regulator